ncbi:hypothetical protein OK074_1311 [Actinobacteria bacterium OK074]|nr:hypothetical protein OK074_1311 [Actinobacteria bacterium OK074]
MTFPSDRRQVSANDGRTRHRLAAPLAAVSYALVAGVLATLCGAVASLLADDVVVKRVLWVVVALVVAVAAGLWRPGAAVTAPPRDPDRLRHGSRAGSPR